MVTDKVIKKKIPSFTAKYQIQGFEMATRDFWADKVA